MDNLYDGTGRANIVQFYSNGGTGTGGNPVYDNATPGKPPFDLASINTYGEYWAFDQQFYPTQAIAAAQALAQEQVRLRSRFKQTLTVNPAPCRAPQPFIDYDLGDRVPVYASDRLRWPLPPVPSPFTVQPILAWQRIYGIPLEIDDNGTETVRELIVGPIGGPPIGGPPVGGVAVTGVAIGAAIRPNNRVGSVNRP
jgi:hypothetical protein